MIISIAFLILMHQKWALPTRLKLYFGYRVSKEIKPLDCLPCFLFWSMLVVGSLFYFLGSQTVYQVIESAFFAVILGIIIEKK